MITEKHTKIFTDYFVSYPWIILLLVLIYHTVQQQFQMQTIDLVYIGILLIQTFGTALILRKKLNLDKKKRTNRTIFLLTMISGWLIISAFFFLTNISEFIRELVVLSILITTVLTLNNIFYRISFHVALNTSILILLNHLSDWSYWPLFLLVPFIAWTRLKLKKHLLYQVILGFLVPFAVYFLWNNIILTINN